MDCNEYQQGALRTWPSSSSLELRRANAALGLTGEAGELGDLVKKILFHDHDVPPIVLMKELGDVLYYVAVLAAEFGLYLDDVATSNQAKLQARYPEGYSHAASKERKDVDDQDGSACGGCAHGAGADHERFQLPGAQVSGGHG